MKFLPTQTLFYCTIVTDIVFYNENTRPQSEIQILKYDYSVLFLVMVVVGLTVVDVLDAHEAIWGTSPLSVQALRRA